MQKVKIPKTIDPVKVAKQRLAYEGIVELNKLSRLEQLVQDEVGEVLRTHGDRFCVRQVSLVHAAIAKLEGGLATDSHTKVLTLHV